MSKEDAFILLGRAILDGLLETFPLERREATVIGGETYWHIRYEPDPADPNAYPEIK